MVPYKPFQNRLRNTASEHSPSLSVLPSKYLRRDEVWPEMADDECVVRVQGLGFSRSAAA